jgi:hypothetical protein
MQKNRSCYIDYLIIAIVVVVGYWQVSLYQYTIKCDASLLSLPWKKFVSDSLRSGYFPVWNPYINLGWTQGMEPSSWYYPSWVFALFGKYRLSYLHTEITLHLILGGIGMYKLLSLLKLDRWALIGGSMVYIFSGLFIGNFQHLGWTFYGCWLPVFLYYFFSLVKQPDLKTALKFGFTGGMLVMSSYIPFIITTFIFLILATGFLIARNVRQKKNIETFKFLKFTLISVLVLFIICAPAFFMLYVNLDTMYRGGRYDDKTAAFGSLVPMSWTGFIAPFGSTASSKTWSATDISMNNIFIGVISIFLICFSFAEKEKKKIVWITAGIGLFALLFSFGSYIPPTWFIFRHIPFYEKLRFASQFRVYFIAAACILTAIGTNHLIKNNQSKRILIFTIAAGICCLAFALSNNNLYFIKNFYHIFIKAKNDQTILASIKFQLLIWGILFIGLAGWLFFSRKNETGAIKKLIVSNIIFLLMAAQMNMFYTGVANETVSEINKQWLKLPHKFTSIPNKPFNDYWNPGIGQTWTNTGTLNHVPNINCYHPYDSKNYGEYERHGNGFCVIYGKVIVQRAKDFDIVADGIKATDSILFTPYSMSFTTSDTLFDEVMIKMSTSSVTTLTVNKKATEFEMEKGEIKLLKIEPRSKICLSFLPEYIIFWGWTGITGSVITLMMLLFICLSKKLSKGSLTGSKNP